MTYSLGEVEALCRKAARGAGFSWGMADEAGKVARWLCRHGFSGAAVLAGYLEHAQQACGPDDPALSDWSADGALCPLICGTLLSDMGATSVTRRLHTLAWPILLLPHIGADMDLCLGQDLRPLDDPMTPLALLVTLQRKPNPSAADRTSATRATIAPDDMVRLTRLAARTYAPETDASKLSGAGAGLKDED